MESQISWSSSTLEQMKHKQRIEDLYKRGLESVRNTKLYGYTVDLNNPKEIIACLYILAEEYNSFHERF